LIEQKSGYRFVLSFKSHIRAYRAIKLVLALPLCADDTALWVATLVPDEAA